MNRTIYGAQWTMLVKICRRMPEKTEVVITGSNEPGDGLPCSACGQPVLESEPLYTAMMRGLTYGFHAQCYRERLAEPRGRT